ncbi:MAG: S41 family peptidase [Paenibacillus dendritiformis]|uniref:S41 family peptidase n=1 Tax=uncultured Paenibacillus sp. TaxID=227322 RepID=UPI0025D0E945|nr:S41 family peptidase [uncultured Paenibacillus sp.]MDU5140976.1 S41 family peptidase [Paenibacillus dendritiformis]
MKKASLIVLTAILFLMSAVPAFAKETEKAANQELENVRAFAKLYGYVRFFHPSDENEMIDWNRFAIHGVIQVRAAKTKDELTTTLQKLFYPIAPTMKLTKQDNASRLSPPAQAQNLTAWLHIGVGLNNPVYKSLRLQSDDPSKLAFIIGELKLTDRVLQAGETVAKQITPDVYAHIPLVLYRDDKGTIGATPKSVHAMKQLQQQLASIDLSKASIDDKNVRLANIVITWNVLQHFYPYFDVVKVDWEQALTKTLEQSLIDSTADQFFQTVRKMLEKTQDGHSLVQQINQTREQAYLPLSVQWIEEQVVISNVREGIDLKPGDIIVNIDGKSATTYFKQLEKYISGTTQLKRWRAAEQFVAGKIGKKATLTVQREENRFNISIPFSGKDKVVDEFIRPVSIEKVADEIYYVNTAQVTPDLFKEKLNELANAKGVIFDLRGYPAQSEIIHLQMLSYLSDRQMTSPKFDIPIFVYPDHDQRNDSYLNLQSTIEPLQPTFRGKIVFLAYGASLSAVEATMGVVEHYRLGEIVGETTAGVNGNINNMNLPGGIDVRWTGMRVLKHDGSQHHLVGIQPTVPVKRTIKELREGRDIYMEKAIEVINAAQSCPRR